MTFHATIVEASSRRERSNGRGKTVLREIVLAADHNAYHVGQWMMVRRILGA